MEESFSQEDKIHTGLEVEGVVRNSLQSVSQWTNINAIIGFISLGLSVITTFTTFSRMSSYAFSSAPGVVLIISSVVSIVFNLVINISLFNFSKKLKQGLDDDSQEALDDAATHIKSYFKLMMLMIIFVVILASLSVILRAGSYNSF